jgi:hypothetical protein
MRYLLALVLGCCSVGSLAADAAFTGAWKIDLRTADEKAAKVQCGEAGFELVQLGKRVAGSHWFVTAGCGRQNEGGEGTVRGVVVGNVAVLVVTSSRNGAVVLGTATLEQGALRWEYMDEISPGEPETDSPLILDSSVLQPVERQP